jgi:glutathione-regulated potassium-efflux system ancillary protein KefG
LAQSVLLIFAHPAYYRSRACRALRQVAESKPDVMVHDLYETYPDFLIDIPVEQSLLAPYDHIVVMHPFYWYSSPAIFKEWQDLVLEYGWAYGEGGHALAGKTWTHVVTAGGGFDTYGPQGRNRFSVEQLMAPFEATAHLCQCVWRPPFVVHGSRQLSPEALHNAGHAFGHLLEDLIHGR